MPHLTVALIQDTINISADDADASVDESITSTGGLRARTRARTLTRMSNKAGNTKAKSTSTSSPSTSESTASLVDQIQTLQSTNKILQSDEGEEC